MQLVAQNTPEDINNYYTEQEIRKDLRSFPIHCKSCGDFRYRTGGELLDCPECPACGL